MFDWSELQRWHVPESRLPFRECHLVSRTQSRERTKWFWAVFAPDHLFFPPLLAYLHYSRKTVEISERKAERQSQRPC